MTLSLPPAAAAAAAVCATITVTSWKPVIAYYLSAAQVITAEQLQARRYLIYFHYQVSAGQRSYTRSDTEQCRIPCRRSRVFSVSLWHAF